MYTEENQRGRFPLRDILLKAIVVIIFLILIIFIITKVTEPSKNTTKSSSNYDKVFSENLEAMEKAAYSYFTTDRLPKELGEVNELTLREMINSNLLNAFTDADGNACDVNNSFIRLTKNDNDYTLRVNLECDKKEDYTLTKVGEYDYCEHDICKRDSSKDKKETTKESEETKEVEITEDKKNTTPSQNSSSNTSTGSNGSTSNSPTTNTPSTNTTPQVTTMYEYRKVTAPVLSNWSSWSSWQYNTNRISAIKCSDTDANCLKEVLLYSRREQVGTKDGKPVYGTVNYYSTRTRTLISSGSTDTKWSTYNDKNLLNQGYTYTGNTR
ncbi:MAG TPA: hypothetical protein IAB38_04880 [Candidatus Onthousia excrementipullorum]|uniref:Uncharacterized protein n=1 Tax=Candidatus Onthousia excrementipullorum TaxID=2840884 RepID=A0A9D1DUR6_9FIRM|nr:hypothetical protein [Candidatus Onthousia excrementipullorum]